MALPETKVARVFSCDYTEEPIKHYLNAPHVIVQVYDRHGEQLSLHMWVTVVDKNTVTVYCPNSPKTVVIVG